MKAAAARTPTPWSGRASKRGDYPYGKYQVMGENIPKWTKGYLGREMTPQEFLADPEAQEQVATARGGEYMTKYGPNGAAAAWFAGEKGMNDPKRKDTLGTHVAEYGRRFNIPLVSREQVVRSAARAPGGVPEQPVDEGAVPPGATPASAPPRQDIAQALARSNRRCSHNRSQHRRRKSRRRSLRSAARCRRRSHRSTQGRRQRRRRRRCRHTRSGSAKPPAHRPTHASRAS